MGQIPSQPLPGVGQNTPARGHDADHSGHPNGSEEPEAPSLQPTREKGSGGEVIVLSESQVNGHAESVSPPSAADHEPQMLRPPMPPDSAGNSGELLPPAASSQDFSVAPGETPSAEDIGVAASSVQPALEPHGVPQEAVVSDAVHTGPMPVDDTAPLVEPIEEPEADHYAHEGELHLGFHRRDNRVIVKIIEAKCFQKFDANEENMSLGSTSLDDPDNTFNDGGFPKIGFELDRTGILFDKDVACMEHNFWVEVYVQSQATNLDSEITRSCQAIAVGAPARNEDGAEGYAYNPVWNEDIAVNLDGFLPNIHIASVRRTSGSGENDAQDSLDMLWMYGAQLHCVLFMNSESIGEVSFPVKNLLTHEAWYPLTSIDATFMQKLKRTAGKETRIGRFWDADASSAAFAAKWYRKLISIRLIFLIMVFIELTAVIIATTLILYNETSNQLHTVAEQLARQVWRQVNADLSAEFTGPAVGVAMMAGSFMNPRLVVDADYNNVSDNLVASTLFSVLNNTDNFSLQNVRLNVSLLYAAWSEGSFSGISQNRSITDAYPWEKYVMTLQPPGGKTITRFLNSDCNAFNESCFIYNLTRPGYASNNDPVNVTTRPWWELADNHTDAVWSNVYEYVNGDLGMTVSYRVPQNLSVPTNVVTAADVTLSQLNLVLASLDYYRNGAGYLVQEECLIVGSSVLPDMVDEDIRYTPTNFTATNNSLATDIINESGSIICPELANNLSWNPTPAIKDMPSGGILAVGPITTINVPLYIVVVIPREDIVGYIDRMVRIAVYLSILILFLSLLLSVLAANLITRQLIACTKQLRRFAVLDFSKRVSESGLRSPIKEIARIYEALHSMRLSMRSFSKYIPPDVVRMLVDSENEAGLQSQKRVLTIFFTDIVDFTTIAEDLELGQLMEVLGMYLEEMSQVIQDNEGTVDKYIGDAIMALWNAPETVIDHQMKACETALLYQARLAAMQDDPEWLGKGFPRIEARIGIHTGTALVGNFGARERLNYTALGDSVNLASRLEGLNKEYGTRIMISDATYKHVSSVFLCRPLDLVAVKGKTQPSKVYELVAHRSEATQVQEAAVKLFTDAFALYHVRKFNEAASLFQLYLDVYNPKDKAAKLHLETCREYAKNPPGPEWKGVRVVTTK